MTDTFYNKVQSFKNYGYKVICLEGTPSTVSLLNWARNKRHEGYHIPIFFKNNRLEVHIPNEIDTSSYENWKQNNGEIY